MSSSDKKPSLDFKPNKKGAVARPGQARDVRVSMRLVPAAAVMCQAHRQGAGAGQGPCPWPAPLLRWLGLWPVTARNSL